MNLFFVNLKRFDVPRQLGGVCPFENPKEWVHWVMGETIESGIGKLDDATLTYLLPEGLIIPAIEKMDTYPKELRRNIHIGNQGVFREDVAPGKNFGAFTTNLPALAAKNMGSTWTIIGHSEEVRDKLGIIEAFCGTFKDNDRDKSQARKTVSGIINEEIRCALKAGLNVLFCVGEDALERGDGSFEEQKPRIRDVLREQLEVGLESVSSMLEDRQIVIGYEPVWAIGPGKTPPDAEYIGFVSSFIKETIRELYPFEPKVIYGGGLKNENAGMISQVQTIDGGLVALTKFTGEIGFHPAALKEIIDTYLAGS